MTDEMMNLRPLVESADADLLHEMIGFAAERLVKLGSARRLARPMAGHALQLAQHNG